MSDIKYHPLINADTHGTEKNPMFCVTDEELVKRRHKLYLEELVPRVYRLCSTQDLTAEEASAFIIHCPLCGRDMKAVSGSVDGKRHALYECPSCRNA